MKKAIIIVIAVAVILMSLLLCGSPSKTENIGVAVKEIEAFAYCCLTHKGPYTEIENVIAQLMPTMQSQNIMPMGPMIGVYYNDPAQVAPEELEWEIGFPVAEQAMPQSPLEKKVWSFTTVAAAVHKGAYEETGQTYAKIFEWMEANGYEQVGPVLEKYLTMPMPETKPEDLRSEIWVPCKKSKKFV